MVLRMPRSLDAARKLVAEIDRLALAEKAEVTRSFVSRVLGKLTSPGLFNEE
jgi:predicted transcriptional regulator